MIALPLFTLFGEEALEIPPGRQRRPGSGHRFREPPQGRGDPRAAARAGARYPGRRRRQPRPVRWPSCWTARRAISCLSPPPPTIRRLIILHLRHVGQPKGALHAHRVLLGHLPGGWELPHHFFPRPGDRFWTSADWAWIGGLLDCCCPAGSTACRWWRTAMVKFDPERAMALMRDHAVRNVFLPRPRSS